MNLGKNCIQVQRVKSRGDEAQARSCPLPWALYRQHLILHERMCDNTYKALPPKKFTQALLSRVFIEGESHSHRAPSELISAITQSLTHPPQHTQRARPETYKIGIPHKSHCWHRLSGSPKAPANKGVLIRQNIPRTQRLSPSSQSGA